MAQALSLLIQLLTSDLSPGNLLSADDYVCKQFQNNWNVLQYIIIMLQSEIMKKADLDRDNAAQEDGRCRQNLLCDNGEILY